jgi:hypothetical protein
MTVQNNPLPGIRIHIPPQMPLLIPKLVLGMPALPLTMQKPFDAIKQVPEGGTVNANPVSISGASVGGGLAFKSKKGTNSHRRNSKSATQYGSQVKTNNAKTPKGKGKAGNHRKLLRGNGGKFVKKGV